MPAAPRSTVTVTRGKNSSTVAIGRDGKIVDATSAGIDAAGRTIGATTPAMLMVP